MEQNNEKINEIVNNYTEQEILEALIIKMGYDINKVKDVVDDQCLKENKKEDDNIYHAPSGTFKKLNTFKGKKALVGDYSSASFYNTQMVLDSLGIEIVKVKEEPEVFNRISSGENFDVIFTNNIYQVGDTGPQLLEKLKKINGFDTPIIIHTISNEPKEKFLEMGFDGCLKKPIKQEETIELLNKLF